MTDYLELGKMLLTFSIIMIPFCLICGVLSAIIDCIWPDGREK